MTNIEQYEKWLLKRRLLGVEPEFAFMCSSDDVCIKAYNDCEHEGKIRLEIPSFVSIIDADIFSDVENDIELVYKGDRISSMAGLFRYYAGRYIDLSNFNTQNIHDMSFAFNHCDYLEYVNLCGINTSKVTDMSYMFADSNILKVKLSELDTSKVKDMSHMFDGCEFLESVDINIDTSRVENMSSMFYGCTGLKELELDSFVGDNIKYIKEMFKYTSNLNKLSMKNFDIHNLDSSLRIQEFLNGISHIGKTGLYNGGMEQGYGLN